MPKLGGGTTNFLRADGSWAAPPGGSGTLPSQTGNANKLLSTNGTDADWRSIGLGLVVDASSVRVDSAVVAMLDGTQTISGAKTFNATVNGTGPFDMSGGITKPHAGATDPATCAEGQIFYNTTSHTLRKCTATNTWADAGAAGGGDVTGPATNTDNNIPQWNGANSKTLKDGLAVSQAATANAITQRNSSGEVIAANTVATGKTPVDTDTAQTLSGKTLTAPSLDTSYLSTTQTAGTTGTTANLLCSMDSSGNVITTATGAVGSLGICVTTQTSGQSVQLATRGIINGIADNSTTIGNLVGTGTTTAGRVKDLGQVDSTGVCTTVQIMGRARTAVSAGAAVSVQLYGPGHYGSKLCVTHALGIAIGDPAGSALATGVMGYISSPWTCTIKAYTIIVDAGTATIQTWKVAAGTAIPTVSNTISTSGVSISTGTVVRSTTLTDFTSTAITAGDIIAYNLGTVATAKFASMMLECLE